MRLAAVRACRGPGLSAVLSAAALTDESLLLAHYAELVGTYRVCLLVAAVAASALMRAFSWAVHQIGPSLMGGSPASGRRMMSLRCASGRPATVGWTIWPLATSARVSCSPPTARVRRTGRPDGVCGGTMASYRAPGGAQAVS